MNEFNISFDDTKIIRDFEGESLVAYKCPVGKWTISYGLTGENIVEGLTITKEQSQKMFMDRINGMVNKIKPLIKVKLTNNQFIAILSLVWNIGIGAFQSSTLLRLLNNEQYSQAAEQFLRWDKGRINGELVPIKGLTNRRIAEKKLFLL